MLAALPAGAQDATEAFLKRHWAFPIQSQGKAPKSYTALETKLSPNSCGACHPRQYDGWRNSLHSHAMGPGVMGQLLSIKPNAVGELRACTRCHAPLAEQEASMRKAFRGAAGGLHEQGLVCAACHVRRHVRYGPPPIGLQTGKSHGGFVSSPAFEDGRFCATCHQFGKDGYVLNGKPLENTYAEWQASPYAYAGTQCQNCHMPERQHLWRGIHDVEMSRKGVTVTVNAPVAQSGRLHARLAMTNSGTGHYFPTYVTPRVSMQIYQVSEDNKAIFGTLQEKIIARQVSADLDEELSDTRLAPGAQAVLEYLAPLNPDASAVVMRVHVEPDHFYTGLYRSLLDAQPDGKGMSLIRAALDHSLQSAYDLYIKSYPLTQLDRRFRNP